MGDLSARWFSDFLGREVRLVRFDPEQRRLADRRWTGASSAENAFQDGFPLLVASTASLDELNRRLALHGGSTATMARFRPNIVLDGLDAHGEDALGDIVFEGDRRRRSACGSSSRAPLPDSRRRPATAETGHAVGDILRSYRADPRTDGAVTFGMNAVVVEGFDCALRVGMSGRRQSALRLTDRTRCTGSGAGNSSRSASSPGAPRGTRSTYQVAPVAPEVSVAMRGSDSPADSCCCCAACDAIACASPFASTPR